MTLNLTHVHCTCTLTGPMDSMYTYMYTDCITNGLMNNSCSSASYMYMCI